jgi:hypothetical protein
MKYTLVCLLIELLISSCEKDKTCHDKYAYLNPDELSWLSYSGGEVLIFKSNDGIYDTTTVTNRNFSFAGEHSPSDPKHECTNLYQIGSIEINWRDSSFAIFVSHYDQDHAQNKNSASIGLGLNYLDGYFQFGRFSDLSPQNNISINGSIYNDVYIMSIDTTYYLQPTIWRIYYTKQEGLIKFDVTHGQEWIIVN